MTWRHVLVVAVALLAISSMPAAAQNASAVASRHTTFGTGSPGEPAPTQLTNMTVEGSGESASVAATSADDTIVDDFSDGDLSEYSGDGAVSSSTPLNSGNALVFTGSGNQDSPAATSLSGLPAYPTRGDTFSYRVEFTDSDSQTRMEFGADGSGNRYSVVLGSQDGLLFRKLSSGSFSNLKSSSFTAAADTTYRVEVEWGDPTISVRVYQSGSQVASLQVDETTYDSGGIRFGLYDRDTASSAYFDDLTLVNNELSAAGQYVGAAHDAENVTTGWANLSIQNAEATVTWQEDSDADGTWTNVTSTTATSTTNVTQDLSATTSDRWRVRVDYAKTGANADVQIHDEGLLFSPSAPTLSDPEPPDEAQIQNAVGNVSINVSDADFPLAQGDSVDVSATDADGNSLGSTTLTSNGTASLSYSSVAGENTIQWSATDSYGTTTTFEQTFETPGVIEVRNESEPGTIVSTASNITATFYGDDGETVIQKSSSDGTIQIAGVPTNTEYVVAVNANGYRPRRVRLTNLFDQRSVYLLPEGANSANIQFELNDRTGNFPSDSELIISKPITRNNSTTYVDIAADSFGATGSTRFILEDNSRYLLRVKSPDGSVREIGAYTTSGAAVEPIPIGRVSVGSTIDSGGALQTGYITENGKTYLRVTYADPDNQTESLTYKVVNETGGVVEPERTVTVSGEYRATIPVNSTGAATVNYSYTRQTGAGLVTKSGNASVGGLPGIARGWPIDEQVLSLSGYILVVGVTGLLVIRDPGVASIAGTVVASLLTFIGVVAIPYMALGVAGVTAVLFNIGRVR